MNNTKLIKKAVKKEPDAFTELFQQLMPDMYRVALAILMNDEDAADAIGDTILACWEKIGNLKRPEYFKTWLTKIVINKSNDILRKRRHYTYPERIPEQSKEDHYNLELKEALSRLDEKYRLPVILYYFEGYNAKEIAKILDVPESTVHTRLQRARKKLRSELSDLTETEENNENAYNRRFIYNEN